MVDEIDTCVVCDMEDDIFREGACRGCWEQRCNTRCPQCYALCTSTPTLSGDPEMWWCTDDLCDWCYDPEYDPAEQRPDWLNWSL